MAENPNSRLEAFSDGVFAIAITLLILDLKVPPLNIIHSDRDVWYNIAHLWPSFFALSLSFTIILISWVGHHNIFKLMDKTSAQFQFANGFFLFTIIFFPFSTAFMAEYINTPFAQPAIVLYCLNCVIHNIGWNLLLRYTLKPVPLVTTTIGLHSVNESIKGNRYGFFVYLSIIAVAWWLPYIGIILSVFIWIYWLYLSVSVKYEQKD